MKKVHAHDLLDMIADKNTPMTTEEIKNMAVTNLGAETSYFACSVRNLDIDGIIAFFIDRGKITTKDNGYIVATGEVCSH